MWCVAKCMCFMFQSLFFFCTILQFVQFHSCRDLWRLRSNSAVSIQPPTPALCLWHLGGRAGLPSCWLEDLHTAAREFQAEEDDDIWADRASLSSSLAESAWSNPKPNTSKTQMGSTVDKKPVTSSGNCPTDNANGLPSPRSRQKSFLGF